MSELQEGINPTEIKTDDRTRESSLGKIIGKSQKFARNTERVTGHLLLLTITLLRKILI